MKQSDRKDELLEWLLCPRCGGKTRTQIRSHTVLEAFPLITYFLKLLDILINDNIIKTENE